MRTIEVPFRFDNGKVADTRDQRQIVEQQIINCLVTMPFERPMLPAYGANVFSLLYEINDELIVTDFKTEAIAKLNQSMTSGQVMDIEITSGSLSPYNRGTGDETTMSVTVYYRIPPNEVASFTFVVVDPDDLTSDTPIIRT